MDCHKQQPVFIIVREIPKGLFDIAPQASRRRDDYDEEFESAAFSRKPYSMSGYSNAGGYSGFKRPADTSYKKVEGLYIPRKTPEEDKPFISKMAGIKKGSDLASQGTATADYGVGDRVRHIKFGEGTVFKIEDSGNDKKVSVQFDTAGTRVMYASFAKLVKI